LNILELHGNRQLVGELSTNLVPFGGGDRMTTPFEFNICINLLFLWSFMAQFSCFYLDW